MKLNKRKIIFSLIGLVVVLFGGIWLIERNQQKKLSAAKELFNEGEVLFQKGTSESLQFAIEKFGQAKDLYNTAGDKDGEAKTFHKLGLLNYLIGNFAQSLDFYTKESAIRETVKNKADEALMLKDIGRVYNSLDEKEKALSYYEKALRIWREIEDKNGEATALNNIGTIYQQTDDKKNALNTYQECLLIWEKIGDKRGKAFTLHNVGTTYRDLRIEATFTNSIFSSEPESLPTVAPNPNNITTSNSNLKSIPIPNTVKTSTPSANNQSKSPSNKPKTSLKSKPQIKSKPQDCIFTNSCGGSVSPKNKPMDLNPNPNLTNQVRITKIAFQVNENENKSKSEEINNPKITKNKIEEIQSGKVELYFFRQALSIWKEIGDQKGEANTLNSIGATLYETNQKIEAIETLNQALQLCRFIGNKECEALSANNLMAVWKESDNQNLAVLYGKQAVNLYQQIRSNIQVLDTELQKTFLKSVEDTYRYLADVLINQGRITEAEQVLAMLKEEESFSYMRGDKVAEELLKQNISLTDEEREALVRYNELGDQTTAIGKKYGELYEESRQTMYKTQEFPKQKELNELKNKLDDAKKVFQKFLDDLKIKFGQKNEQVVQIDSGLQNSLKRLKATHTAIVSTIVGENRLNIIVTTANAQRAHRVDISEKDINKLVADFRQALTNPEIDPRPVGQKLYDILVKPIETDLKGIQADSIVWSLDGTLRYIPTAALWDKDKGYLAEHFASSIITLASFSTIELPIADKQNWNALGVGVSKPTEGFSELTAVPDELDCIITDAQAKTVSLAPKCQNGVMNGKKLLDENFTLAAFENDLGRYPIIHIASHFSLKPGNDKDSFLLLGGGDQRRFTVENLRSISLSEVELIALSACNTATPGGEKNNGVEIEGFGVVAQKQGAKAVMATLWSVADSSTQELMVKFYELYSKGNLTKSEALRQAQLALLNEKIKDTRTDVKRAEIVGTTDAKNQFEKYDPTGKPPFAHPYYWSPFVLIGNWK